MAGAPSGFGERIDRKYDIQQEQADSERDLRAAQATGITGALPYENALRASQAYTTREQGRTFGPLAAASIAHTNLGEIPLEQSQAGLLGTESAVQGFNTFGSPGLAALWNYWNQTNQRGGGSNATMNQPPPATGSLSTPVTTQNERSVTDRQGYAAGTSNVQLKGKGKAKAVAQMPMGAPGAHPLAGIVAHAMQALHAAGGATTVMPTPQVPSGPTPTSPGDTVTSGNWGSGGQNQNLRKQLGLGIKAAGGAVSVPPVPAPGQTITGGTWTPPNANPPSGQNQDLRKQMGYGVKAAGGATTIPPVPAPGQTITNGTWAPPNNNPPSGQNQDLRKQMGYGVKAAGGASNVQGYKSGTAKVPGRGNPGVDSVPATLAPGEAVLNQGAANHMGRGAIAMLNAIGAHTMAMAGTPPQTPPSAHGVMSSKPMARGAPAPKKVAAGAARK